MIYSDKEQAQLECDLLNRKHEALGTGRTWVPVKGVHVVGGHTGSPYEDEMWQPTEAVTTAHGPRTQAVRRTMFINT